MTELLELIFEHDELALLDPAERRLAVRSLLAAESGDDRDLGRRVALVVDHIDGYGPLSSLMRDRDVTDVLVNGPDEVWIERTGTLEQTDVKFADEDELCSFVERFAGMAGTRADLTHPIADARLPDGSRMHVVMPPLSPRGPTVSIRRFPNHQMSLQDLAYAEMLSNAQARLLAEAVAARLNVAISGATGSGKTTLLNALLSLADDSERIVTVEETPELDPACAHRVALVARPPNLEGRGEIPIETLVRAALRMRPDRIVVGEVRGPEALVALDALSTGHSGSMTTLHAAAAERVPERLVEMALGARTAATEASLRARALTAFDLIVHLERSGHRRVIRSIMEMN
ncbi:MAG: CpaF family protein [Actinomycetota bacterium]